jgi:uncharacterized protein YlxW (UPF0749 family)
MGRAIVNRDNNNGIFIDSEYSNFSFGETLKRRLESKKKKAQAEADAKAKAELDNTKAELEKTKSDIEELKSKTTQVVEEKKVNLPETKKSNKLPLIIGSVAVLGIATFVLIKKLKK